MSLLQKCYIKANFLSCIFFLLIGPFTALIFQEVILISCLSSIGKVKQDQYVTSGELGGLWERRGAFGGLDDSTPGSPLEGKGRQWGRGWWCGMEWGGAGMSRGVVRCNCLRMHSRNNYCASSSVGFAPASCFLIPMQHMKLVFYSHPYLWRD